MQFTDIVKIELHIDSQETVTSRGIMVTCSSYNNVLNLMTLRITLGKLCKNECHQCSLLLCLHFICQKSNFCVIASSCLSFLLHKGNRFRIIMVRASKEDPSTFWSFYLFTGQNQTAGKVLIFKKVATKCVCIICHICHRK